MLWPVGVSVALVINYKGSRPQIAKANMMCEC